MNPLLSIGASVASGIVKGLSGNNDSAIAEKAKKSAQDFEAVFLTQILNSMSAGLDQDSSSEGSSSEGFNGGSAEAQWRSLGNDYVAKSISASGGIGLADSVMKELLSSQGA